MVFLFRPHTQYENLGDAFIAKNLINLLTKKGTVYIDDKGVPEEYLDIIMNEKSLKGSLTKINFIVLPFVFRLQGKNVKYVFKPGHHYGGTSALGGWLRIISLLIYFSFMRLFGVELIRTGVSIGPLTSGYKFYESMMNKLSTFTGVREEKTFLYLKKLKMKNNYRVKDLAFYSFPDELEIKNDEREYISFSFRSLGGFRDNESADIIANIIFELKELTESKLKKEVKLALITQVQRDHDFNILIANFLEKRGFKIDLIYIYMINKESYEYIGDIYSKSIFVLSNRLHALLYGLNYGAFPIGVGDGKENFKVKHILDDTKLNNVFFDLDEPSISMKIMDSFENNDLKNVNLISKLESDFITVH